MTYTEPRLSGEGDKGKKEEVEREEAMERRYETRMRSICRLSANPISSRRSGFRLLCRPTRAELYNETVLE